MFLFEKFKLKTIFYFEYYLFKSKRLSLICYFDLLKKVNFIDFFLFYFEIYLKRLNIE